MKYSDYEPQESWHPAPTPWEQAAERSPSRVRILEALLEYHEPMLEYYGNVLVPSRPTPTSVGALISFWEEWELAFGPCGGCGSIAVATRIGGPDSTPAISGYCLGCEHVVQRRVDGSYGADLQSAVDRAAEEGYAIEISRTRGWRLQGHAGALVAALQEVGAQGLPVARKARL